MNRINEMDSFLKYLAELYYYNPGLEIKYDTIYSSLATHDLSEEELNNRNMSDYFEKWINRYAGSSNLNVFHSDRQPKFLQFQNTKNGYETKCVKLYVSYPKDKLYECANAIFDFIEANDFSTASKIADRVRADSIVLRMSNIEDARKVIQFINNDLVLSRYAKKTNPFLVREGVVGVAYDDMMSYNSVLSELMREYFKKNREDNTLRNVSLDTFKEYVLNMYNNNFKDANNINRFCSKYIDDDNVKRSGSVPGAILNYEQVYRMIMISLRENVDYNNILNEINRYQDEIYNIQMLSYYETLRNNSLRRCVSLDRRDEVKQIIDSYIIYASQKYGSENVPLYLDSYRRGNLAAITRENNFRNLFHQYITPEIIDSIANGRLISYVESVVNLGEVEQVNNHTEDIYENSRTLLNEYIKYAAVKYGVENISFYLKTYINGNNRAITRDCNYRNLFVTHLPAQIVSFIVGSDMDAYIYDTLAEIEYASSGKKTI